MTVSPLAPALWIVSMAALAANLLLYVFYKPILDPLISIMFYLFCQEASKFVAEITMKEDDGPDSHP